MATAKIEKLKELGFTVEDTGGGCTAFYKILEHNPQEFVRVTDDTGSRRPHSSDKRWFVGLIDKDGQEITFDDLPAGKALKKVIALLKDPRKCQ